MIFYFSGTGNSLAAAKALLAKGEALVNMAEANREGRFTYQAAEGEAVGFVFPVYFYSLPMVVIDFLDRLQLKDATYLYAVITCGGGISQAGAVLKKKLSGRGLQLDYVRELLMPDNYILLYPNKAEGVAECLSKADESLKAIRNDIENRRKLRIGTNTLISDTMAAVYRQARKTKRFNVLSSCVGCGLCEKNCPEGVISLASGRPVWTKEKCTQCLACINRCLVRAIQYGKRTRKQGRYVHPELK